MQIVYNAENLIDAHLVRHALEQAGIPAFVRGEALLGGIGELPPIGVVTVAVPYGAWKQARGIVDALGLGSSGQSQEPAINEQGGEWPA